MITITSRPSGRPSTEGFTLGISMGSANHSGEMLASMVQWANGKGFEYGIIDLSDSLNRYSLMLDGIPETLAHAMARQQGEDWLRKNEQIL